MTSSSGSNPPDRLDAEQRAAVTAGEKAIAVLAGPGSGKTRTLSFRTGHLLSIDKKASALLLTFTNKAAAEMKSRALSATGLPGKRIHASTFHTFCADVLRAHGELVGVSRDFEILDEGEAAALARDVAMERKIGNGAKPWGELRLRRLAIPDLVAVFGQAYEAEKRRQEVVDFNDLVVLVADIFEQYPEVAQAFGAKYQHVLIDEFQDTNAVQLAVISAIARHAATVSIFADDDQAIFGFAGAESENIERFSKKLGAREFPLTVNYRSRAEIVKLANALIDADAGSSGRHMRANTAGGTVSYEVFPDVQQEGHRVATAIAGLVAQGASPADIGVLVRNGYRANDVVHELQQHGLPVSDWRSLAQEPEERRALSACLAVVRGTLAPRVLTRLTNLMDVPPSSERRTHAFLAAHANNPVTKCLVEVRRLAFEGASPHEIAGLAQRAVLCSRPEMKEGLSQIVDAVSNFELYDREFTLEHLLSELALGSVGRPPTVGGGVKVATLHRTKGLQWKFVYLVGLEDGQLPSYKARDAAAKREERRLCFVGVSRAQEALTITRARIVSRYWQAPSKFLVEMDLEK